MKQLKFTDCVEIVGEACQPFPGYKKYVSTGAVDINHFCDDEIELVDYGGKPSRANLIAKSGDILFAKMIGTKKTLHLDEDAAQNIYSTGFCAVRARPTILTDRCLYHLLTSKAFLDQKDKNCSGATQKAITNAGLSKITIKVPSIGQQASIVQQLDRIVSIIALRQSELQKLDDLVKARFVEMFGAPETNSKEWSKDTLSNHLNVIGGYAFKSDLFAVEGIPVLRIGNINAGFFQPTNMVYWKQDDSLSRYMMYAGDLVMSLTGTVGKDDYGNVCILGNDYDRYYLNQRNAKLELFPTLNKHYLSQILKFPAVKKKLTGISRGVRQANISNKDILNLEIPIPPIDLQNQFAVFVKQVDKSKVVVLKALDKAQTLFDSLMQQYFG